MGLDSLSETDGGCDREFVLETSQVYISNNGARVFPKLVLIGLQEGTDRCKYLLRISRRRK